MSARAHRTPQAAAAVLALVAVALVASVRAPLFDVHRRVKEQHDVYFLPPPDELVIASLGYRHALADLLWAHVLVEQGLHTFEKRRFGNLLRLYDAIGALDPTWRAPYLYADALVTFQPGKTPLAEVEKAREILERGTRHRPFDAELWLSLGQFVAFMAPASHLADHPAIAERWRREGADYLARAAELGAGHRDKIAWQALGGATILRKQGEREAAIRFLQRILTVTDDDELRRDVLRRLAELVGARDAEAYLERAAAFKETVVAELPFISRDAALVLGSPLRPASCAGPGHGTETACATSWRDWAERYDRAPPGRATPLPSP
jgi:tetratricopeptide (TPR) repeat protein